MKTPIKLLITTLATIMVGAVVPLSSDEKKEWLEPQENTNKSEIEKFEDEDVQTLIENQPEFEVSWAQMVRETVKLWELFFDADGAPMNDPRRDTFEHYAEYLADTVIAYQNRETDIGGRLPKHENTHLMIASLITKESSVDPSVIGRSHGEVGFLQLHGKALGGIKPEVVRQKPKLGIYLGVRWLAAQIPKCFPEGVEDNKWRDEDWLGPLSVYGGGEQKAIRKDGTCKVFKVSKKKLKKMQMYRSWIDAELVSD